MSRIRIIFFVILGVILLQACGGGSTPKPRGYFRIDFPEKEYQLLDSAHYPYRFSYPTYGTLVNDDSKIAEDYWVNIDFPQYKARIHISYKEAQNRLDSLTEDSRTLAYKHALKAEAISEKFFEDPEKKVYGMLYNLKGNTASSWQFYVTDSVKHFVRGALYFSVNPNKDSLSPAIDFFGKDVVHIMETIEWNH
ncbi:gliding motility lipoprotein GldD [Perlabentimonas gracilis]|uniref:gliding motility lipoprotein GldD n=1 Tax=Perlabentimonas gracilis TaxID=2715279 RepID=UPI00140CEBDF|nr:gliding motility lipoprotein GldD [Perlabentimonas gracilis]NHB69486.1 gliding motility lipoprotein GldD [Perlabentimonas gracilis]